MHILKKKSENTKRRMAEKKIVSLTWRDFRPPGPWTRLKRRRGETIDPRKLRNWPRLPKMKIFFFCSFSSDFTSRFIFFSTKLKRESSQSSQSARRIFFEGNVKNTTAFRSERVLIGVFVLPLSGHLHQCGQSPVPSCVCNCFSDRTSLFTHKKSVQFQSKPKSNQV